MSGGQIITGGSASVITTLKVQVSELPSSSETSQVTVVVPTWKKSPLYRPSKRLKWVEQLSVAVMSPQRMSGLTP
jgi:hypothetical protein